MGWIAFICESASCMISLNPLAACCVCVGYVAFVICRYNCIFCVFPCVSVSVKCVCVVFPASSSSPSGAPASLSAFSSPGCDHSQLTPPLLWQPKNSLEKGQLAAFPGNCPDPWTPVLHGVGAPSVGYMGHEHHWKHFPFPLLLTPEPS